MEKRNSKIMDKYSDDEIIQNFFDSWKDGDPDDIKSSLYAVVKRLGGTRLSAETGIPRTTLYDMCKDNGNPTLDNLCLVYSCLKLLKSDKSA